MAHGPAVYLDVKWYHCSMPTFFTLANTTPCHVGFSCLSFVLCWKQCLPFLFWLASDVNKCWKMISGRCLFRCLFLFFVFVLNSGMITEKRSQNTTKTNQQLTRSSTSMFPKTFFFLSIPLLPTTSFRRPSSSLNLWP